MVLSWQPVQSKGQIIELLQYYNNWASGQIVEKKFFLNHLFVLAPGLAN